MAKYYLNNELIDTTADLDTKLAELDASAKVIKDAETTIKECFNLYCIFIYWFHIINKIEKHK